MRYILLIFVAKFQIIFLGAQPPHPHWGGAQPLPKPHLFDRPILLPPEHCYPPGLGGLDETLQGIGLASGVGREQQVTLR